MAELLPQRPPFLFVDRLMSFGEETTVTEFTVPQKGMFVEDGMLMTCGIVEHMAQSSAARIGYISKYILREPVKIGFIGAVRNFTVSRQPRCGETLSTSIIARQEVFGITLVDAIVKVGEEIIAQASLKTALGDKDA